jgi:hypothetical protein
MGLRLEDLGVARAFMIEEIDMDARNDQIYLSTYLTQSGQGQWADMLRAAAQMATTTAWPRKSLGPAF